MAERFSDTIETMATNHSTALVSANSLTVAVTANLTKQLESSNLLISHLSSVIEELSTTKRNRDDSNDDATCGSSNKRPAVRTIQQHHHGDDEFDDPDL
jgi:hypothetical protein